MYKDLSLKEKAKVIREGVRLGLNSIDDILSLYDEAISYLQGGPIVTPYGQWKYPGRDTIIPSNNITMDNVNYPVLGVSDTGDTKVMMPWNNYKFRGSMVYEHPLVGNLALEGKKFNKKWKALDNILYNVYPDTTFTREKTGVGDIEVFNKNNNDTIIYPNKYSVINPYSGLNTIIYNPNTNDEQDIRLDALHLMSQDVTYDVLNTLYREKAKNSDVYYNALHRYNQDIKKYGRKNIDSFEQYYNNEADGLLRNMFIEGTPEYIESKRYYPDKKQLKEWNSSLLPYIDEILKYLETGERPKHILPEVVITPNEYKKGGNLFLEKGFINRIKPIEEYITPLEPLVQDNTYMVRNYPYYLLPEVSNKNKRLSDEEISNYYGSNIVWTMENPNHKGLNPDGTYSAYEDEAGFNFGPGLHAKSNNLDINKTYTKQELDSIASNIALNYMKLISEDLETMQDERYAGARDTLSAGPLLTMLDIAYNVKPKNKGNMPQKWPNLTDSLINGNIEKAKENTYSGSTRRQKMRNLMIVYKPLEGITVHNEALGGNLFKKGGIYIKPENRGKFTALKKRTGHSASWFKAHGTPALKKMATFALNSKHWNHKHDEGGHLFLEDGQIFKRPQDDLTGRNILTSPILPPKSYYEQFTIPELEPKKPQPLQPLEGTYGNKYSELVPMSDGTYVNNPINKGLQLDWRTHMLEFAPFLAIGAGPAIGSTATWLASKPALYNLGRMTLGSEIGGRSVDLASNLFTGNTWGLNVGNVVEGITGWNPNSTLVGLFVTDAMNPGYYISPSHIVNGLSNITKGVGNVLSKDYVIPFGFRRVANDGQVTNQLKNFRSNYLTRSTINKVLRNNPNLNSEYRENLVEAAKNMVYTKPVDGSHRMYMTFNGETPRMTPDGIFQYNMEIPRYDRWSNLHEIGHFVDDATGLPSSNLQRIPGYRYSAFDESTGTPMEQFADMFANKYSRRRLPYDIQTHEVGLPWSLLNRINTTKDYNLADDFLNITNLKTGEVYKSGRPRASISTRQYGQDNIMGLVPLQSMVEWTPEQWTAAQDAAIARGDIAEAQRLRDLHFRISAPNTEITDIQYHGSPYTFNVFDPAKRGNTDQGWFGKGYYFTPSQEYAAMYGDTRPFYINAENVYTKGVGSAWFGKESSPQAKVWLKMQDKRGKGPEAEIILDDLRLSDAVRDAMPLTKPYNGIFEEVVTRNNNQMKLANAVTFDDLGRRIPLGERDNFNLKDIRYGLIPLGGIGLYGLQNRVNKHYD